MLKTIFIMPNKSTNPDATLMIVVDEKDPSTDPKTYQYVYVGNINDLPSDVLTEGSIVNDLSTGGTDKPLSAEQGRTLNSHVNYTTCGSNAADQVKLISDDGFELSTHLRLLVRMTNTNTHATPKFNINNTGVKDVWYNGSVASDINTWAAGEVLDVYYDGSNNFIATTHSGAQFSTGEKIGDVGIDDEPTAGSDNLVKSGGVRNVIGNLLYGKAIETSGGTVVDNANFISTEKIPVPANATITYNSGFSDAVAGYGLVAYSPTGTIRNYWTATVERTITLPDNTAYIRACFGLGKNFSLLVNNVNVLENGFAGNTINELMSGLSSLSNVQTDITNLKNKAVVGFVVATTSDNIAYSVNASGYDFAHHPEVLRLIVRMPTAAVGNATLTVNGTTKYLYYNGVRANAKNTWNASGLLDVYYDTVNNIFNALTFGSSKVDYTTESYFSILNSRDYIKSQNQIDPILNINGYRLDTSDNLITDSNHHLTPYIPIKPNTAYTIVINGSTNVLAYHIYDKFGRYIEYGRVTSASTLSVSANARAYFIRMSCEKTRDFCLNEGSSTTFVPFKLIMDSRVDIDLQDNPTIKNINDDVSNLKEGVLNEEESWNYDEENVNIGYYIEESSGTGQGVERSTSGNYSTTPFIPVAVGYEFIGRMTQSIFLYSSATNSNSALVRMVYFQTSGRSLEMYRTRLVITQDDYNAGVRYIRANFVGKTATSEFTLTRVENGEYGIVCLGDSIFGKLVKPWDIPTWIQKKTGIKSANCAFGGTTACAREGVYNDLSLYKLADCIHDDDFTSIDYDWGTHGPDGDWLFNPGIEYLKTIDYSKLKMLTIAYGTNDWNSGKLLDNTNNKLDTTTFLGAIRYSIEQILSVYPNIVIALFSPIYRFWEVGGVIDHDSDDYANPTTGKYLIDFVDGLKGVAEEYHLPFFDNYRTLGMNILNAKYFIPDGTHFAQKKGYLIGQKVGDEVCSVI